MNDKWVSLAVIPLVLMMFTLALAAFIGLVVGGLTGMYVSPGAGVTFGIGMFVLGLFFGAIISIPAGLYTVVMVLTGRIAPKYVADLQGRNAWFWPGHVGRWPWARTGFLYLTPTRLVFERYYLLRLWPAHPVLDVPVGDIEEVRPGWSWFRRGVVIRIRDRGAKFLGVSRRWIRAIEAARRGEELPNQWIRPGLTSARVTGLLGCVGTCVGAFLALNGHPGLGLAIGVIGFVLAFGLLQLGTRRTALIAVVGLLFATVNLGFCLYAQGPTLARAQVHLANLGAVLAIDPFYWEQRRLPDAAEAAKLIVAANPDSPEVRYRQVGRDEYELITSGIDETFNTPDDEILRHRPFPSN